MPTHHACTDNRRCYRVGGVTICVESDLPITDRTFHAKFKRFECSASGEVTISLRHHFFIPVLEERDMGVKVHQYPPWVIYRAEKYWTYLGGYDDDQSRPISQVAVFNPDHTKADIYHHPEGLKIFQKGGVASLSLLPTDQIILARVLADRQDCILHSGGIIFENNGLLFVGHSDAGKSTLVTMLQQTAEILCDDRIIIRQQPAGCYIYGTWFHGDVPQVSPASAPLKAILFLKQARSNQVIRLDNRQEIIRSLLACLIKPLATADWWHSMLTLVPQIAAAVPCYSLEFDKSGRIVELLRGI